MIMSQKDGWAALLRYSLTFFCYGFSLCTKCAVLTFALSSRLNEQDLCGMVLILHHHLYNTGFLLWYIGELTLMPLLHHFPT